MNFDWFARAFGAAVADVRQKVIEEPFFGKVVTPRAQTITLGVAERTAAEKSPAERLGWQVGGELHDAPDITAREPKEQERGIDR